MRKIDLLINNRYHSIDSILDNRKISVVEFKLGINDCNTAQEIENYLCDLREKDCFLGVVYWTYTDHKDYWLFYFYDRHGLNNQYHLLISKE